MKRSIALIIAALSTGGSACAPKEGTFPLNEAGQIQVESTIDRMVLLEPLQQAIMLDSKTALVDAYGEYSGNEKAAKDWSEALDLLQWYYDNDRIRYYTSESTDETCGNESLEEVGGCYSETPITNYIYLLRDNLDRDDIAAHEILHATSGDHGDAMKQFMDKAGVKIAEWRVLQKAIEFGDPSYQYGEITKGVNSLWERLNPEVYMPLEIKSIVRMVESGDMTLQEGYDNFSDMFGNIQDWVEFCSNDYVNLDRSRSTNIPELKPLALSSDEIVEDVMAWEGYQDLYHNAYLKYELDLERKIGEPRIDKNKEKPKLILDSSRFNR